MVIVPLLGLVGVVVGAAVLVSKYEVAEETRERLDKEAQDLAREERLEVRTVEADERREKREDEKLVEAHKYTEEREAAKLKEDREYKKECEPHAEAKYLVPFYTVLIGVPMVWEFITAPCAVPLTLKAVTVDGLKFDTLPVPVPFHHVKELEAPSEDEDED